MSLPSVLRELDPTLASTPQNQLTANDAQRLLIRAIYTGRLDEIASAISEADADSDARDLAKRAQKTVAQIETATEQERVRLANLLTGHSIVAVSAAQDRSILHRLVYLRVDPSEVDCSVKLLQADGYIRWDNYEGAAWEMFKRANSMTTMLRNDKAGTRVELRWSDSQRPNRWQRIFRPTSHDLGGLDLPTKFWPFFYAKRPLRVLRDRLRPTEARADLGPFLGTPAAVIPALLIMAGLSEDDVLFDIGSGDGRILIEAARLTGCRCVGFEQSETLVDLSRREIVVAGFDDRIEIRHQDGESADFSEASVIFVFLPAAVSRRLIPGLLSGLGSGGRLLVHEQAALGNIPAPVSSLAIFGHEAITVAHLWSR